jgi:hypothetical protein
MNSFKSLIPLLIVGAAFCTPESAIAGTLQTPSEPSLSLSTGPTLYRPAQFELSADLVPSSNAARLAPGWADYKPSVSYDFDQWFKSNATTIAIVAVAILLLIIIAD